MGLPRTAWKNDGGGLADVEPGTGGIHPPLPRDAEDDDGFLGARRTVPPMGLCDGKDARISDHEAACDGTGERFPDQRPRNHHEPLVLEARCPFHLRSLRRIIQCMPGGQGPSGAGQDDCSFQPVHISSSTLSKAARSPSTESRLCWASSGTPTFASFGRGRI